MIWLEDMPYFFQAEIGMTEGENNFVNNGIVNLATASACGESLKPM